MSAFHDFDLPGFWDDDDYALQTYVSAPPSAELILSVEVELGYKLPASYVELMQLHNGGIPRATCFPTTEPTSWADNHVAISGILGIGRTKSYSLCGKYGSPFMLAEWGYPPLGIYICDCPSAGHDIVMLDYSACGPEGEPHVVHIDQENEYKVTWLAENFEQFIRGLVSRTVYDTSAADLQRDLQKAAHGSFSPLLTGLISKQPDLAYERIIRTICGQLIAEKGFFSFHADELSVLMYDVQFLLYNKSYPLLTEAQYLAAYPAIITFAAGEFSLGGYAPSFLTDWLADRRTRGQLVPDANGYIKFTERYEANLKQRLRQYAH